MSDTRTAAEIAYDAERDGTLYTKPGAALWAQLQALSPDEQIAVWDRVEETMLAKEAARILADEKRIDALLDEIGPQILARWAEEDAADGLLDEAECPTCTPERDCPACTARYEADCLLAATADDAPTMRGKIEILMSAGQLPSGDQLFDLMIEDRVAHYLFLRTIDWVLWRQAHGKPVKTLAQPDRDSAVFDARHDAARVLASDLTNYGPHTPDDLVYTLCAGEMIEQWERTPEEKAQIDADNQLMIEILELVEARDDRKRAA